MTQIKWVFQNMKGYRWQFFLGCFINLCIVLPLDIVPDIIISEFIDRVFTNGNMSGAHFLIGAYLIVRIIMATSEYVQALLLDNASAKVLAKFRTVLYEKLQKLTPSYYNSTRTGDIMMRLTGDLETMRHFVSHVICATIYAILLLIASIIVFYSTNAILASLLMAASPFMGYLIFKMRKVSAPMYMHLREMNSHLNAMVQENIAGNRVVKAFVRERFELKKFEEHNENYRDAAVAAASVWAKFRPIFDALANGVLISVLIIGGIMVIYNQITIGEFLLFYNLNWLINSSMRMMGVVINDAQRFFSSTQKVMQLYYARCDIENGENPYIPNEECENGGLCIGKVEFENVSFNYDSTEALKDISLVAEQGQTIGIMGPTGSGKSTLAMLMARFADVYAGSIKIDDVDIRNYDLTSLRKNIGISMQDVFLFSNTIDANIAYGSPEISAQSVVEYAKMADADDFVRHMPDGYDTVVGERGVGLSGGQKQRIALARALAYETPIVILDDTTSAVDMETEKHIQTQLAARKGKHTTFIIAQRISSVKNADKIFIIEDGKITESGTHKELLEKKGYYYDIYCLQQGNLKSTEEASTNV